MLTVSVVVTGTYLMVKLSRTPDSGDQHLIPILLESMLTLSIYILSVCTDLDTVSRSVLIDKSIVFKIMLLYLSATLSIKIGQQVSNRYLIKQENLGSMTVFPNLK